MPSKSRAQQRLMQAAEHGAQFPMAQKIRQSMTHQQMHDFASGPETGKPQYVKPEKPAKAQMHPVMQARAQMVKTSHAHLAATVPGFTSMPKKTRMMAVQAHVRTRMGLK